MKVILQESIDSLGSIGDVITVRDGYARNYLLPRNKAVVATPGEMANLEKRRVKIEKEKVRILEDAKSLAEKLKLIAVKKTMRVGEEGQLYGSVGVADIAELLAAQGHEVEKKQILLSEPVKKLGVFQIPVRLHADVTVEIQLTVEEEKTE